VNANIKNNKNGPGARCGELPDMIYSSGTKKIKPRKNNENRGRLNAYKMADRTAIKIWRSFIGILR
jgi:hypothetical protein